MSVPYCVQIVEFANRRLGQRRFDLETPRSGANIRIALAQPVFALWATTGSLRCSANDAQLACQP